MVTSLYAFNYSKLLIFYFYWATFNCPFWKFFTLFYPTDLIGYLFWNECLNPIGNRLNSINNYIYIIQSMFVLLFPFFLCLRLHHIHICHLLMHVTSKLFSVKTRRAYDDIYQNYFSSVGNLSAFNHLVFIFN